MIVIGSGPAGAHAALALAEAGVSVHILDGGNAAPAELTQPVNGTFMDVRKNDPDQWKLFVGSDYSGIPVSGLEGGLGGGMTSGNRSYVVRDAQNELPLTVENGVVIQSLATGGLGAAWGGASAFMDDADLELMGLPAASMQKSYDEVSRLIGISGPATHPCVQPAVSPDAHARRMLNRAERKSNKLRALNVSVAQPHTALLTQPVGDREPTALSDMDYYADPGRSVYRPQYTIDDLQKLPHVRYTPGVIVQRVEETADGIVVFGHRMGDAHTIQRWTAKRVIVAAGAVNTARILLQSKDLFDTPVPFVAKPHSYIACLHPALLGAEPEKHQTSLCQLIVTDKQRTINNLGASCAQLYSYRSLLLFRLLGSIPFPVPEALGFLSLFSPALVLADVRFPATTGDGHTLMLRKTEGQPSIFIRCSKPTMRPRLASLKTIKSALKTLGLLPLKTVHMPEASTSHHAGTVPVSEDTTLPLSCDKHGRVQGMRNVYVADASMFRCLPALPHTLTIMANARRVGGIVKNSLN